MSQHITLKQAKAQLRVDFSNDDAHIQELLDRIEGIVESMFLDKRYTQAQWDALIANPRKYSRIKEAILILLTDNYTHRDGRAVEEDTQDVSFNLEKINYKAEMLLGSMIKVNI